MINKLFTSLKIAAAILVVIQLSSFSSARADDPAYYKLEDVKELTIYKEGDTELRPTFSFETVAFGLINPGWGKRTSSFGEFGRQRAPNQKAPRLPPLELPPHTRKPLPTGRNLCAPAEISKPSLSRKGKTSPEVHRR
jgi:hypothetical protein